MGHFPFLPLAAVIYRSLNREPDLCVVPGCMGRRAASGRVGWADAAFVQGLESVRMNFQGNCCKY